MNSGFPFTPVVRSAPRSLWLIVLILAVKGLDASAQSLWELTPYRVTIWVAADSSPKYSDTWEERAAEYLAARTDAVVGARFVATATPAPTEFRGKLVSDLASVTWDDVARLTGDEDKIFLLSVQEGESGTRVRAREVDVRTQYIGHLRESTVVRREDLNAALFRAMMSVFAPLAEVESVEGKQVGLRLRGGSLPSRDPDLQSIAPGDLFHAIVRYNHADGRVRNINRIPWTYLVVDSSAGAEIACRLHTGLRGQPLSSRRRDRFEKLALLIRAPSGSTRFRLVSRDESHRPLVGYEVYSYTETNRNPLLLGRTDGDGAVVLEPTEDRLFTVVVKNGRSFLARFPVVPGFFAELEALVPDDDERLAAEGFITGMQEQIVDMTTRREVLIAMARARLAAGEIDAAERLVEEIREIPDARQLTIVVRRERSRLASAEGRTRRKIDELFDATQTLLNRHLNPAPVDEITRDVTLAARAAREAGAGGGNRSGGE